MPLLSKNTNLSLDQLIAVMTLPDALITPINDIQSIISENINFFKKNNKINNSTVLNELQNYMESIGLNFPLLKKESFYEKCFYSNDKYANKLLKKFVLGAKCINKLESGIKNENNISSAIFPILSKINMKLENPVDNVTDIEIYAKGANPFTHRVNGVKHIKENDFFDNHYQTMYEIGLNNAEQQLNIDEFNRYLNLRNMLAFGVSYAILFQTEKSINGLAQLMKKELIMTNILKFSSNKEEDIDENPLIEINTFLEKLGYYNLNPSKYNSSVRTVHYNESSKNQQLFFKTIALGMVFYYKEKEKIKKDEILDIVEENFKTYFKLFDDLGLKTLSSEMTNSIIKESINYIYDSDIKLNQKNNPKI